MFRAIIVAVVVFAVSVLVIPASLNAVAVGLTLGLVAVLGGRMPK